MTTAVTLREENNIEQSRIVTDQELPPEFSCPVCQCLLWKPVSCSQCQQVFCQACLELWSQNTDGVKKCPFRCQSFEERRCPPYFLSLLSRIRIRCRNASFGCPQILTYDTLEHHEAVDCQFLTRRCTECQQLVLVEKFAEHENTPEACAALPIKCIICHEYFQKHLFRDHFQKCNERRMIQFFERARFQQNLQFLTGGTQQAPNDIQLLLQAHADITQVFEEQRNLSRLPTKFKGLNDLTESRREQPYGYLYRIYSTLRFVVLNWPRAPFLVFQIATAGFVRWITISCIIFFAFFGIISTYIRSERLVLYSLLGLLQWLIYLCLNHFPDTHLIILLLLFFTIDGCSIPLIFEQLEMNPLFDRPFFTIIVCLANLLLIKLAFLLLRLYFWCISIYSAAGLCILLSLYIYRKHVNHRRPFLQPESSSGLTMPV